MADLITENQKLNLLSTHNPAWYRALFLSERAGLAGQVTGLQETPADFPGEKARRQFQKWQEQPPFNKANYFKQRVAADNLTEENLLALLAEPEQALFSRTPFIPGWLEQFVAAFENQDEEINFDLILPDVEDRENKLLFLNLIKPLVATNLARLQAGIRALAGQYPQVPFKAEIVTGQLLANLPALLATKLARVIALEINVARVQGRLEGETPQERFNNFISRLSQPANLAVLLEEYPVLARQLVITVSNWLNFSLEFLGHLCADWEKLGRLFWPETGSPGQLVEVEAAGDSHRGGRSVVRLKFDSGYRLIYKPKPVSIDVHFNELLGWLSNQGLETSFRVLKTLDSGKYGWSEFAHYTGCSTAAEVHRFYRRQGGYLALLYTLQATDFHSENLIAAGEHPVLVDLEALFHPRLEEEFFKQANDPALDRVGYSVLRIGMLPERTGSNVLGQGLDISGLGGKAGQLSPTPINTWEGFATDEMRIVKKHIALEGSDNRPTINGAEVELNDYLADFLAGFKQVYLLLAENRKFLREEFLPKFKNDPIRVIVRSTKTYSRILKESFHPELLKNALTRNRFLDKLWLGVAVQPFLARLISAEQSDLLQGDIPLFTTLVGSRDLTGSQGDVWPNFFNRSSLESVSEHIGSLSQADLETQLWFIKASFATLDPFAHAKKKTVLFQAQPPGPVGPQALVSLAARMGDRLHELALIKEGAANWAVLNLQPGNEFEVASADYDLYSGLSGISLFLAYLGKITGNPEYTGLARQAFTGMNRQLDRHKERENWLTPGAFSGIAGAIHLNTHLAELWQEPALLDEAVKLAGLLPPLIRKDQHYDLLGGSAGTLLCLLNLYKFKPDPAILELAVMCGDHLLTKAVPSPAGLGWTGPISSDGPLTGLAHGAAGIGLALLALGAASKKERFHHAGKQAFAYENSTFSQEKQNWPDLRNFGNPGSVKLEGADYLTGWCYGAAGIGLSRVASLAYLQDVALGSDIKAAVQTTLKEGFGTNYCLCHGDLGNMDLILAASLTTQTPELQAELDALKGKIWQGLHQETWDSGSPFGVETPELMTGLAGAGYMLLRLAYPREVPSVLVLEPPIKSGF